MHYQKNIHINIHRLFSPLIFADDQNAVRTAVIGFMKKIVELTVLARYGRMVKIKNMRVLNNGQASIDGRKAAVIAIKIFSGNAGRAFEVEAALKTSDETAELIALHFNLVSVERVRKSKQPRLRKRALC